MAVCRSCHARKIAHGRNRDQRSEHLQLYGSLIQTRLGCRDARTVSMDIKSFHDLDVWCTSMELARRIYTATGTLPWPHRNEIGAQMRRASVSAPSNVAEGFRQGSLRAYARHIRIAAGSMAELETQAQLATDLKLWPPDAGAELKELSVRCSQMLTALALSLEARDGLKRRRR